MMRAAHFRRALRVALVAIPASIATFGALGCFAHTHLERNANGHVDLDTPPRDPKSPVTEPPADPGERGVIVGTTLTVGGGSSGLDTGKNGIFAPGIEASFMPFSLQTSHRGTIVRDALADSLRVNVGWNYVRTWGTGGDDHVRTGPVYLEAQYTSLETPDRFWGASIALGAAMDLRKNVPLGPQATGCVGIPLLMDLCSRATWIPKEGSELIFFIGYHGFAEWVWSK